jgi:hypothetical protein
MSDRGGKHAIKEVDKATVQDKTETGRVVDFEVQGGGFKPYSFTDLEKSPASIILVIGKRNSGKAVLAEDIMKHISHKYGSVIVQSGTESENGIYGKFIPDEFIYGEFNAQALENFYERQFKNIKSPPPVENYNPYGLIVLDDVFAEYKDEIATQKIISILINNGRHRKVGMLIFLQEAKQFPPKYKSQVDQVFMFQEEMSRNIKDLYNIVGGFEKEKHFAAALRYYTENFGVLVSNKIIRSNQIERRFYWYKAQFDPHAAKWWFGGRDHQMWKFHEQHYLEPESEKIDWDNQDTEDPADFMSLLHGSKIKEDASQTPAPEDKPKKGGAKQKVEYRLHKLDAQGNIIQE